MRIQRRGDLLGQRWGPILDTAVCTKPFAFLWIVLRECVEIIIKYNGLFFLCACYLCVVYA